VIHFLAAGFVENFEPLVPSFAGFGLHRRIAHAGGFFRLTSHFDFPFLKLLKISPTDELRPTDKNIRWP
jgi:hypothetical protein